MVYFHEGYVGNCLVNVGCIGIMKKDDLSRSRAQAGEVLVLVGGKTGRDGIHGVTFASVELTGEEEFRSAVQVGDPITKEPLMHAILEANEKRLISGMKDLGGGGLSCAVSEMCHAGGCGGTIHLEQVKLKEAGLKAWEIWVSESQERFLLSVKPPNVDAVLGIFAKWDVDATVIGETTTDSPNQESPLIRIYHHGEVIFELETRFLLSCPLYVRPRTVRPRKTIQQKPIVLDEPTDYNALLLRLLASPNIASRAAVIRQYDHEVRAATVIKPLQGLRGKETHGDAAVIKPLVNSYRGLAITADVNPSFCKLDPFWGAASAIDETCRNLAAVGAVPHSFVDCLNFGNPEKPDRMEELYECCRGLGYMAASLGIPFVSGNVSLYNESAALKEAIPPTPTILGIGICADVRDCVTVDAKAAGNRLYLLGETKAELGGTEYLRVCGSVGGTVPRSEPRVLKQRMSALHEAMNQRTIASCHDLSEGGLAVAICELLLGGDIGASIELARLNSGLRSDIVLFSESNSRWVVEVWRDTADLFEAVMASRGVYCHALGETEATGRIRITSGERELVNLPLELMRAAWISTIV
jgi:phosphoribosylformylglycinamidine synthase